MTTEKTMTKGEVRRAFGLNTVPGTYEDIELADLVILAGSSLAWCHPVIY